MAVYASEVPAALDRSLLREGIDEIRVMDGSGHFFYQQDSQKFHDLMLRWLERNQST
jgi:putative component of toxin-antitoxin plasmid stabilization module